MSYALRQQPVLSRELKREHAILPGIKLPLSGISSPHLSAMFPRPTITVTIVATDWPCGRTGVIRAAFSTDFYTTPGSSRRTAYYRATISRPTGQVLMRDRIASKRLQFSSTDTPSFIDESLAIHRDVRDDGDG